jgi:DNA end-binding protein Ku
MAPRAYWKGYLRLSLVSCPISLFPATSEHEKVRFHQINSKTGNRIRYHKVDESTGEEVPAEQIVKAYEVGKGQYIEITDEELEAIALESTRTIEINEFVPRKGDRRTLQYPPVLHRTGREGRARCLRSDPAGHRRDEDGRDRSHCACHTRTILALEPRGKGIMGTLLRYPYEVRDEKNYFDDIPATKLGKDAIELAKHIVQTKSGHFQPEKFDDHYEAALRALVAKKEAGERIEVPKARPPAKVINLMDALKQSIAVGGA